MGGLVGVLWVGWLGCCVGELVEVLCGWVGWGVVGGLVGVLCG